MTSGFSPPYLFLQAPLHSPPNIPSSTSDNFSFIPPPYFFTKPSLQSPPTLPSSTPQPFYTSLFLHKAITTTPMKNASPTLAIQSIQAA